MAVEAGKDSSVRMRLKRDASAQPGGDGRWLGSRDSLFCRSAQAKPSGVGEKRSEFVFQQGAVQKSQFYRYIVKPARREAAIEMPQSRGDDPDDGHPDIGAGLVEDEKIKAGSRSDIDASVDLLARVCQRPELRERARVHRRLAARHQEGMLLEVQRSGAIEARFLAAAASHQSNRQELVQLRQCAQHGNSVIEVRARTEFDIFLAILHPVQDRDESGNPKVAGNIKYPKPSS